MFSRGRAARSGAGQHRTGGRRHGEAGGGSVRAFRPPVPLTRCVMHGPSSRSRPIAQAPCGRCGSSSGLRATAFALISKTQNYFCRWRRQATWA